MEPGIYRSPSSTPM